MKALIALMLVIACSSAGAQNNWVQCKNLRTGAEQSFEGRCPNNWYPI